MPPNPAAPKSLSHAAGIRQRILIAHFDLFRNVGGGQSVYHAVIAQRPDDMFYYFCHQEPVDSPRPANAVGIPYFAAFGASADRLPSNIAHFFGVYIACRNMAAAVAQHAPGIAFDVVDVPDFSQFGLFIAHALAAESIAVGSTVVALHGTLSSAFRAGWPAPTSQSRGLAELRVREQLQFRVADARYAISDSYAEKWRRLHPLAVNRLDPLCVTGRATPHVPDASAAPPDLAFVGRREKWKGPDLFVDLAWTIDPAIYRRLILAGPDGPNQYGLGSEAILAGMAQRRGMAPEIVGSLDRAALLELYARRTLLLLPSRHDTFNLTALEAVLQGCPVHVSRQAGVATWLSAALPDLPWMSVDIDCSRSAAAAATATLRDYDRRRGALVEALHGMALQPAAHTMQAIYAASPQRDNAARQDMVEMAARFAMLARVAPPPLRSSLVSRARPPVGRLKRAFAPLLPGSVKTSLDGLAGSARTLVRMRRQDIRRQVAALLKLRVQQAANLSPRTFAQIRFARRGEPLRQMMLTRPETRTVDLEAKLRELAGRVPEQLVNRVPLFSEMARLERRRGNDLIAATYGLRGMRWMGRDASGDLPFVAATLRANGFPHEADAAEAMFGPADRAPGLCFDLLRAAYARNRHKPDLPLAVLDDRRGPQPRRIGVIVSLYNAADKLPTLLRMLSQQTVAQRGELEVVLVDSNSPGDEHGAMAAFLAAQDLPVVFARSAERETIQAAWNRGIRLSHAPYLAFLGADEGLHPDALAQLAAALDADPAADWAMADSIVTSVDRHGVFDADVMAYDRHGFSQDLVYLETCYLSWVGGLYRRTIHDRFGYYDESFRAAGDTEFKNRVLPHIRSIHLAKMLGVFNNYPEERTTQHPRAEIEDLRAWYLGRSQGGMRYAFDNRPVADAAALLRSCLRYRKSFCGHWSTDFDLAEALTAYMATRPDAPDWLAAASLAVARNLALMREIDLMPRTVPVGWRGLRASHWVYNQTRVAERLARSDQSTFSLAEPPKYEIFNDNRYEQHWWSWSV